MKYLKVLQESNAYKTIVNDVVANKLSHAYLVTCNDIELVKAFFYLVGCTVFCRDNGCMDCDTCRKILNRNHADIMHIKPEEGKQLKVKDIEHLIESSCIASVEKTNKKLYFILNGERMNLAAQNKLLKTLEEPPKGVSIFIATTKEANIIDTIKSRLKKLYIDRFDNESIVKELSDKYGKDKRIVNAVESSGGSIGLAERLLDDEVFLDNYNRIWRMFTGLGGSSDIVKYLRKPYFSKENIEDTLIVMEMILRDAMLYQTNNSVYCKHKTNELEIISNNYSIKAIVKILELIYNANAKIKSNCNVDNIVDNLLFSMLEVKYKCQKL